MNIREVFQTIGLVLLGVLIYGLFFRMFLGAIRKNELIFHGGILRGRFARILGVIGMLGITAGGYLVICNFVLKIEPPFMPIAAVLFLLFFIEGIALRFLSIFFGRSK